MTLPFSMACGCCPECRSCPCKAGTIAASLQVMFDGWTSAPDGYCHRCDELNNPFEVPNVASFNYLGAIGDGYTLTAPKAPCSYYMPPVGSGCRYEVDEDFECVPQVCLEACASSCTSNCTGDEGCLPENCGSYLCGSDNECYGYGGVCEVACAQEMTCVFNEELDPEHLTGLCAVVGTCVSSVVPDTCRKIRLRVRIMFYVTVDLKPAVSAQVVLFSRHAVGSATATILYGFHEFEEESLDCATLDVDLPLFPISGYTQPAVPACGAPTSVRITGLA